MSFLQPSSNDELADVFIRIIKKYIISANWFDKNLTLEVIKEKILAILSNYPRLEIKNNDKDSVKCTVTTRILSFVDDVEFFIDMKESKIHMRSASRVGYWDLGANRKRLEEI